jgi:hypothetical protein
MANVTITLGGETVEVYELPLRKNRAWCERALAGPLAAERELSSQVKAGASLSDAYNGYATFVSDQEDAMAELVLDYLPNQERRDEYADKMTRNETLKAFFDLANLSLASSFFLTLYGAAWTSGSPEATTGTNSPEPNGASGLTS